MRMKVRVINGSTDAVYGCYRIRETVMLINRYIIWLQGYMFNNSSNNKV